MIPCVFITVSMKNCNLQCVFHIHSRADLNTVHIYCAFDTVHSFMSLLSQILYQFSVYALLKLFFYSNPLQKCHIVYKIIFYRQYDDNVDSWAKTLKFEYNHLWRTLWSLCLQAELCFYLAQLLEFVCRVMRILVPICGKTCTINAEHGKFSSGFKCLILMCVFVFL